MNIQKLANSKTLIHKDNYNICLIDGLSLLQIAKMYSAKDLNRKSVYLMDKFVFHLKIKHDTSIIDYTIKYLHFDWPRCSTKENLLGYKICGDGLVLSLYNIGAINKNNCEAFRLSCKQLSKERMGKKNPMFGKKSWNKGLTKENNEAMKQISEKLKGRDRLTEKGRETHKNRLLGKPGLHSMPHSEKTKEGCRIHTAKLWATGVFKRVTSIHKTMRDFLETLDLKESFKEEFQEVYYSLDFALPFSKVAIECDGDYFHCNPIFFPDGPKDKIQKRNAGRDKAKNSFLENKGWVVLRFWECEINSGIFKEKLLCKLKELNLLKN